VTYGSTPGSTPGSASLVQNLFGSDVPKILITTLERLTGLDRVFALYDELRASFKDTALLDGLLARLSITYRVADADLARVPVAGPVVLVANHPTGLLEGAVLTALLKRVRPDVKFLANDLLGMVPEIAELLIGVDTLGRSPRKNAGAISQCLDHLRKDGLLALFPAGEVSHFQWIQRRITDAHWSPQVSRLLSLAARSGSSPQIVPVHISGQNSALFQAAGILHSGLRTLLLGRELLNKRGAEVEVRIGSPIAVVRLMEMPTDRDRIEYLRWRTYLLESRQDFRARTSGRLHSGSRGTSLTEIASAEEPAALAAEVARLGAASIRASSGDLDVYLASACQIPAVLRELCRLREITFRAAGEGTGKASDQDNFDDYYLHLFIWNRVKCEIAGAYRLAQTDRVPALYTATLFRYRDAFLREIGPALELGRSFVRPEYQRAFAPLLLLWKAIGSFVADHPQYKVLFGAVSISNEYSSASRELMVSFLERNATLPALLRLVKSANPLQRRTSNASRVPKAHLGIEELSAALSDLEPAGTGIPVLLRQYLKLGGKLLAFSVDPQFSSALDGLIVVDLTRTDPKLLERYLGKTESARFLHYQKGNNGTNQGTDDFELDTTRNRRRYPASDSVLQVHRSA
jgi:putative hemolysin